MSILRSLTERMKPVVDENTERQSGGWDNQGFPSFDLGAMAFVHAIWCAVDGGTSFYAFGRTSDEVKDVLLPLIAEHQETRGIKTSPTVFEPPNSWKVSYIIPKTATVAAYETMEQSWAIPMFLLAEAAPNIHETADRPCPHCSKRLFCGGKDGRPEFADGRLVRIVYERSTIGDGIYIWCPECKEVVWLTSSDF
jgi:hypothetical protein